MFFNKIKLQHRRQSLLLAFVAFIITGTFTMCKKDLGNYDYSELPTLNIDTSGIPRVHSVKKNLDELVITPKVNYAGENTLEYYWIRSRASNFNMTDDTISREKDLRMTIDFPTTNTSTEANAYSLFFLVKEKETGRSEFVEFRLFVTGAIGRGLFVAHEKNGSADFDFIETPRDAQSPVIRNVYSNVNNERVPGNVRGIGVSGGTRGIFFATDQEGHLLDFEGMGKIMSGDDLFGVLNHPEPFNPEQWRPNTHFINDGVLYYSNYGFPMVIRYSVEDGSSYRASPNCYSSAVIFDEINSRFLMMQNGGSLSLLPPADPSAQFSLDNIDKKLLFLNTGFTLASSWSQFTSYAVFEDKVQPDNKFLYVFNYSDPQFPDYALVDISHTTDISNAFFYQTISTVPVIYYGTPDKIYLLQINPAGNSVVEAGAQFTAPQGEEITAFFHENDTYCYVATYSAATGKGKVYLIQRATGTGLFNPPSKVWEGFDGRITMMGLKNS